MRDVQFIRLNDQIELVISADCAGAVGEMTSDVVAASNETVAYYTMRVALMELLAVGASLKGVTLHNLTADSTWTQYCNGINRAVNEAGLINLPIQGSSETNFKPLQSGIGVTCTGIIEAGMRQIAVTPVNAKAAVVGLPLVGEDVLIHKDAVASLAIVPQLLQQPLVYEIVPVGSKGVYYEVEQLYHDNGFALENAAGDLDLYTSSGPATCFIITYHADFEEQLSKLTTPSFFPLTIQKSRLS